MTASGVAVPPPRGARLLVIKPKMIGDTLLAMPALGALQRARPDLVLDLVIRRGSEGVLPAGPPFGRVLLTVPPDDERRERGLAAAWRWVRELRRSGYHAACDLTGTERGHFVLLASRAGRKITAPAAWDLHQAWLWRRLLATPPVADWASLHAVERDAAVLESLCGVSLSADLRLEFPTAGARPPVALPDSYAVVQPGSRRADKLWPEDNWREIVRFLARECGHVVLSSGPDPAEVALTSRLAAAAPSASTVTRGCWTWRELAAAMHGARVFAGADTAAAHLAAAAQVPSVVVWGPSHEHIWAPWSDRAWIVVSDQVTAAPATRRRHPAPGDLARAPALNRVATVESALRLALGHAAS